MRVAIFLVVQFAGLAAFAASLPLASFCQPFNGASSEVIWEAPSNFPASVKVMEVVPTKLSPETISNLLWLAELSPKNMTRSAQLDGVLAGKDVLTYANRDGTRYLDIVPSQGSIGLTKAGMVATIPKEMPSGVPDDKEASRLAFDILKKIGISTSELATDTNGKPLVSYAEGSVIHKDKPSGRIVTNVTDRTVILKRQIGDIPFSGMAGISMKFGNEGRLAHLEVTWRSVRPDKDCPVPNVSEFVSRIKSGRVLIHNEQANVSFKRLSIEKVRLYYWEADGSERQSRICPFAVLDAKTDQTGENASIHLFVPLTE